MKWLLFLPFVIAKPDVIVKAVTCYCNEIETKMNNMFENTPQWYITHSVTYNSFSGHCIITATFDNTIPWRSMVDT